MYRVIESITKFQECQRAYYMYLSDQIVPLPKPSTCNLFIACVCINPASVTSCEKKSVGFLKCFY